MKWKSFLVLVVGIGLLLTPAEAYAQKGGSNGGRSSSGWGGSPSSSGTTSKSGWGSSSTKSTPSSSTPSTTSKSGWGGSSTKSAPSGGTASKSGWGGSSSGDVKKTTTPAAGKTPTSVSKQPVAPSFDKVAVADAKKAESRVNYEKASAPAPSYKTPKGDTKPLNPKAPETEYLRGRLDESRWVNRTQRETTFYSRYSGPSYPIVMYSDPWHPAYHYWLLDQSVHTAAMFIICHEMEQSRINDMYRRNAKLEAEVARLRANGTKADPNWYPPSDDSDLFFNGGYVDAVYNPHPKQINHYTYSDGPTFSGFLRGIWWCIKWCFYIALAIFVGYQVFRVFSYFLFQKRYG